jgi:hypothetical protein
MEVVKTVLGEYSGSGVGRLSYSYAMPTSTYPNPSAEL